MFAALLKTVIRSGGLCIIDSTGRPHLIGDGSPPLVAVRVASRRTDFQLALNPSLMIGEAYMDGTLTIDSGSLYDFIDILARNMAHQDDNAWMALLGRGRRLIKQYNPIAKARRNVATHYDLSGDLYRLFLDNDQQYSCAYFRTPDDTLEQAQENKKRHIAAKLILDRPGLKILDIGSGWGGLALYLARVADADVTGLTLSVEQHKVSQDRAAAAGLADRVRFELRDYRQETGHYDRIVSVGMFEHVGKRNYNDFFRVLGNLLNPDGVALLHAIGDAGIPGAINPFIRKHIFPGADAPSLSELFTSVEASGLFTTDLEILRLHYAETLLRWRQRVAVHRSEIVDIYDERFFRMWEFYLTLCEIGFRRRTNMVFQLQLAKTWDRVPITRDYMFDAERRLTNAPHSEAETHRL
ncbi:cyclopropane-fatty-acyl-phospholipid synthase family protein [Acidiphilium sp. PA]|uniref:SAM-dependent methyltransferase n=1 Tax=Acidiphilium sp. PA TaxID=2871705 RepID=UPI00224489ED|nr:cyclopropane-fatty-acyl-phospholipid synthase family protein [Acidiphilium sp. PA]MCW8309352.1 cyclopropane-fatty-acyl-phospholipid synthase family protein [Acidiphilium sp. PA]